MRGVTVTAKSQESTMQEITVMTISAEESEHGVAELWSGGRQIAFTLLEDGELKLRLAPVHDGTPVVVGLRSLADALSEVGQILALGPGRGVPALLRSGDHSIRQ
jgi:hypothetical protein